MTKKTYYVSVQAGTVMSHQGDAAYELEIEATASEKARLEMLFGAKMSYDDSSSIRAVLPGIPYHVDDENDKYDAVLQEVYRLLYELGTTETKNHISSMHILSQEETATPSFGDGSVS
ncbi:hypothetical protein E0485_11365 [Paenibacillus albiflavus]|uniref:Hydrolase n=1 Tax=Paenibacillus albiflavus TaxID=2545760 RepID=A0A4R4EDH2_9BACL|nr:hypothetical protein [Paenibacillus albiflavus]TCZ77060.1 hypothetical protein E0485_11365 [Paenibacillus albiflavus]